MKYKCPNCNKTFTLNLKQSKGKLPDNFPFCSQRCRLIDLGEWFDEEYKVVTELQSDENKE
jgi:hypothetical protein